jgi:hypothetical protein
MKRALGVALIISLFLIVPSWLLAKGATTKIVIEGADHESATEISPIPHDA